MLPFLSPTKVVQGQDWGSLAAFAAIASVDLSHDLVPASQRRWRRCECLSKVDMHTILLLSSARVSRNFLRSLNAVPCRGKKKKAAGKKAAAKPTDNDTDIDVDLSPFSESMKSTISALQRNLSSLRTSGAHPGLLDSTHPLPLPPAPPASVT